MDRVKSAAQTAHTLRDRALRYSQSPRRYSSELNGRLALQLYLVREGIRDAFDDAPVEVALTVEPVLEGSGDRPATLKWCKELSAMYRAWAAKRRTQIRDLRSVNGSPTTKDPILLVSGFGAHRVLSAEAGLHVFEPSEGAASRVAARVRTQAVPLGPLSGAEEDNAIVLALNTAPRSNNVVRRYREQPPLVRDAAGQWRTGRLDLVLGGAFDLLQGVAG
jgi:ATP-dependent Clp protease ATP-binding subunit ClpC